ncbi:diguanylate cyclase (GGDEF)-like protein [Duganella sp. SG902]|uniref:GGDEF domain-containing protein n=1 Tax=Duganella sp. SG902 TaxID=2587016 RepID=UPI001806DED7|nr:GGDEF domain-containing protein [Duganella sp. SG902]NVM79148.1 diguanylate cyclase (GGDEF)-like protein [Duganella sp. SG902]
MAKCRHHASWRSAWLGALMAAVLCAPLPALARTELDRRIMQLRDQMRLVPDQSLAELLALQPAARADTPRVQAELLAQIGLARKHLNQLGTAEATAEQVIAYGKTLRDDVIVANGLLARSAVLIARDERVAAHRLAFEAEQLALRGGDQTVLVRAELAVGTAHSEQGNFPAALAKLQLAVDHARQVGDDPMLLFHALRALTSMYVRIKERGKAFDTLAELSAMAEKQRLPIQMVLLKTSEHTVAGSFGQQDRALRAQLDSLALQRQLGARHMLNSTLNNLADTYLKRRDYARAAHYATEALASSKGLDNFDGDATAHVNLGHAYLGMGRMAEGKKNFEAGLAWVEQSHSLPDQQEILLEYGEALEDAGDLGGALAAYHRERTISNKLFETKRQNTMLELQERYEADKKQRQIESLKSENQHHLMQQRVWWLLAAVFALASVVVGLLYRKVRQANASLETKNLALKEQSTLDPLTGLYNRRYCHEVMAGLEARPAQAGDNLIGALFLLDVDHFKHINDSYGHAAGDAVLKMVAGSLRQALRDADLIVRWGGEEFLAFVPAVPRQRIDEIARRVLLGVSSQSLRHQERDISVRVSIGYAPFPLAPAGEPLSWERVVNLTDMALYLAKSNGRNRAYGVRGFANLQRTSLDEVEQDLDRAWRAGYVDLNLVMGAGEASPA